MHKMEVNLWFKVYYFLQTKSHRLFVFSLKVTGDGTNKKLFEPKQWKYQRINLKLLNR
ncbi:MAG: hypothetical protein RIR48_2158 [Bacteroidota bacterium]